MSSKKYPNVICEVANTHAGNFTTLLKTIKVFSKIRYPNLSIKFQVFSPEGISVKKYHAFNLYKKITFSNKKWKNVFSLSKKIYKEVWIDIFDDFGLNVLKENFNYIDGIKLQASTLKNDFLIRKIKNIFGIKSKKVILNTSGFEIYEIRQIIKKLGFNEKNLILQIGFQDYPTSLNDSGLNKIKGIKKNFGTVLSYADHNDRNSANAFTAPILSYFLGCNYLEKHICLDYKKTKYDLFSSFDFKDLSKFLNDLNIYIQQDEKKEFISKKEKKYLSNSILKPVAKQNIKNNSIISSDILDYKRTDQEIKNFCDPNKYYIATKNIKNEDVLDSKNMRELKIGVIVGARMKSSRLKKKATLKINRKKSILRCLDSASKINNISKFILATSYLKEDGELARVKHKDFEVFKGSPDNLVKRYFDAAKKFKLDIVIRITGDCPYVSKEIIDLLIKSHLHKNADYTSCTKSAHGTAAEIYNFNTLKTIYNKAKSFEHSEYMTWYILNNRNYFKINLVKLPSKLVRNYRMTLDYKQDLDFFNKLYCQLEKKRLEVNLHNIFTILDKEKSIKKINSDCSLIWQTDKNLIKRLNLTTRF